MPVSETPFNHYQKYNLYTLAQNSKPQPFYICVFLKGIAPSRRGCNYEVDKKFWCTITTGQIPWKKAYGGKVCCTAAKKEVYVVSWIKPG